MAVSQSHTLGEFLGTFFEDLMKAPVREFSEKNGLYFDSYGLRKARKGKKVSWTDIHGSSHDLDFVIEKNGTDANMGTPIAFIELAWRRYTKHSKNKAQEIAGAVDPICERYKRIKPFKGAILSGLFTENSLSQLKNDGFHVLYIPFDKVVQAFRVHGFDVFFDEKTEESDIKRMYETVTKKSNRPLLDKVRNELLAACTDEINAFIKDLENSYNRKICSIYILPLHGVKIEVPNIEKAIRFVNDYEGLPDNCQLQYIEIIVNYNNGSVIQCQFKEKDEVVDFLNHIQ